MKTLRDVLLGPEFVENRPLWPHEWPGDRDPEWAKAGEVHDWRNYVPAYVKERWASLSEEARLVAWAMASLRALDEDWD